jgi:anaerobic selenocysteine-containing dehydrogenase
MPSATKTVRTMCPMTCHPTFCGMKVETEDGRLKGIAGDKENPDSKGFLCVRGRNTGEIFGNGKRLLTPMIRDSRDSDDWRPAGWEEVNALIVSRMKAAGAPHVGLWSGHGSFTTGSAVTGQLSQRFADFYGCQTWSAAMVCWGLGGLGVGLTGALKTHTMDDMAANANLVVMWGANIASQPNTAPRLVAARRRGARVVTVDVRRTEASAQSDDTLVIRPGSDTALALSVMHVLVAEKLYDADFVKAHTTGFKELAEHVRPFNPDWGARETGLTAERITAFARELATAKPAMILLGSSSMHKNDNGWQAARAISCLPALTGNFGVPGGGLGPRHGANSIGFGHITAPDRRPAGTYIPNQMADIATALSDGRLKVMLLLGTNMLSSFADAGQVAAGLRKLDLVVAVDLFMNDTIRQCADIVLPGTAWLEEIGFKATNTHLYLMERALQPEGEARPVYRILRDLAAGLDLDGYFPWDSDEAVLDALFDHPSTGRATVASLRAAGGFVPLQVPHVPYMDGKFDTPSGKIEFRSDRAEAAGLPALPTIGAGTKPSMPLVLAYGRTLTHFHSFYDQGQALPSLAKQNPGPRLWISPADAKARRLNDGDAIRIHNERGELAAAAHVTEDVPPGVVWIRDGWGGLNHLSSGNSVVPTEALSLFPFSVGQSDYGARVEVSAV